MYLILLSDLGTCTREHLHEGPPLLFSFGQICMHLCTLCLYTYSYKIYFNVLVSPCFYGIVVSPCLLCVVSMSISVSKLLSSQRITSLFMPTYQNASYAKNLWMVDSFTLIYMWWKAYKQKIMHYYDCLHMYQVNYFWR